MAASDDDLMTNEVLTEFHSATSEKDDLLASSAKIVLPVLAAKYEAELEKSDLEMIHDLGSLSVSQVLEKMRQLQALVAAYEKDEQREMQRAKLLNIIDQAASGSGSGAQQ
ncbi:hypothetical protein BOX15_Mlig015575g1 [Macrostomum lignano]|uniref:Uncharacterized protein n=1 Tax=Macrostomum lignano TaxID=282301 RepID=A0A267FQ13_9PLAT|nr:hypothetical protein BOX15_Mlig015575g1 [Macrostomum lignano]